MRATQTLEALSNHPEILQHGRSRFNRSPPSYSSPAGSSTQPDDSSTPNSPRAAEDQTAREYRMRESLPTNQFEQQTQDEYDRIIELDRSGEKPLPNGSNFVEVANNNIKQHWIKQGIWRKEWRIYPDSGWKHEEALIIEFDEEPEPKPPVDLLFTFGHSDCLRSPKPIPGARRKLDRAKRLIAVREREASRPLQQFIYQILQETQRIKSKSHDSDDIHTKAYHIVKQTWVRRMIWNDDWGIMPGRSWMHEKLVKHENGNHVVDASEDEDEEQVMDAEDDQSVLEDKNRVSGGKPSQVAIENGDGRLDLNQFRFGYWAKHEDEIQDAHENDNQFAPEAEDRIMLEKEIQDVHGEEDQDVHGHHNRVMHEGGDRKVDEDGISATHGGNGGPEASHGSKIVDFASSPSLRPPSVRFASPTMTEDDRPATPKRRTRRQPTKSLPEVASSAEKPSVLLNTPKVSKKKSRQQPAHPQPFRRSPRLRKKGV